MRKLKLSLGLGWLLTMLLSVTMTDQYLHAQCDSGTVSGTVYYDENVNGANENENGLANVLVTVYDASGLIVGQVISGADGSYEVPGLTDGSSYRVEFDYNSNYYVSDLGDDNSSEVQFVTSPNCVADFGLSDVTSICTANPDLVLTCFVRSLSGNNDLLPTVIGLTHDFTGASSVRAYATQGETGSVWGIASKETTNQIFLSSFVKQYSHLKSTHDAIYVVNEVNGAYQTSLFASLSGLGQNVGVLSSNDPFDCNYGDQVGRIGLGSIEISPDEKELYVINIANNTLVKLLSANPTAATTVAYQIPDPGCADGEYYAFALTQYNDKYYVGVTCTAETARDASQSEVVVYEFDPTTNGFTNIFSSNVSLGYWKDRPEDEYHRAHWLTDIAFTDDGNMVLALSDRLGHRYCDDHKGRLDDQKGDLWYVANVNGTWTLESNGSAGGFTGSGVNNGEGNGGGEFFGDDFWITDPGYHNETTLGSVLIVEGTNEVVSSVFDPLVNSYSGGLHRYNTTDGKRSAAIELYTRDPENLFGKATGFGGITSKCGAAGIQIGNLAWIDADADGIQDPGEFSVAGLRLDLYDEDCIHIGSTLTDANGNYNFTSEPFIDADGNQRNGLNYNTCYYLTVDASTYTANDGSYTINGTRYFATVSSANSAINSDLNSSHPDCTAIDGVPAIKVLTGDSGQNDFTFDIGFRLPSDFDLALTKQLVSNKYVKIGDLATFDITVVNQGELASSEVTVTDYVPGGYTFDSADNPGWLYDGTNAKFKINTPILPGQSETIQIKLRVVRGAYEEYLNYAEISGALDENSIAGNDSDSSPDENPNNDTGGILGAASDDQLNGNGINDEDDHDVAGVTVVDLALRKVVHGSTSVLEGDLVRFDMTVFNQGIETTSGFTVVDYLPTELFFDYADNSGWTATSGGLYYSYTSDLEPGDSYTFPLYLRVKTGIGEGFIDNYSEIMSFTVPNPGNNAVVDFDSTPDADDSNDSGASITNNTDNVINDISGSDEDDHDVARISTECFDLALIITSKEKMGEEGKDYKYTIRVENQGSIPAGSVTLVNYIPDGMALADDTWTLENGDEAVKTINFPGGLQADSYYEECITLTLISKKDRIFVVNYAEIAYATNIDGADFSNTDKDSTADRLRSNDAGGEAFSENDNRLSGNGTDDEDDHDPEPLYFAEFDIDDPCLCLDNATTSDDGQFSEKLTINGPSGHTWTIDFVAGLYDIASPAPPAAPVPFITGPAGVTFSETLNGDGTSVYCLSGIHIHDQGYSIRAVNQDGVFLQYSAPSCGYDLTDVSSTGSTAVCIGQEEFYSIEEEPGCTYSWTLSGGGAFTTATDLATVGVSWTTGGGPYSLSVVKTCPDGCIAPGEILIEVGVTEGELACVHDLNISLDEDCCVTITPDMVMATMPTAMASYGVMLLDPWGVPLPGDQVCEEYLGQTIMVKIIDGCTGNSCWSNVTIEDKTPPIVQCSDIDVPCYMVESYMPFSFDNCSDATISIVNEVITPLHCDANYIKEIERTYIAEDAFGNVSLECTQVISVERFPSADVVFPPSLEVASGTEIACSDIVYNADGYPDYAVTGVPTLYGSPIFPDFSYYCNIAITYEDLLINDSECIKKYMRTWTFYEDWCSLGVLLTATQVIEIADMEVPTVVCPEDVIVYTDGSQCAVNYTFPLPTMSDDCSTDLELDISYEHGFLDDYSTGSVLLETGEHLITYTVYDACDNSASCQFTVTVVDNTPPVAVCDENTVVSLRSDGTAYAPAMVFDDGSYDDCGLKTVLVQRMGDFDCPCNEPKFSDMNYLGEYNGHYYYSYVGITNAFLANAYAEAYGGYLAIVNDADEAAWLTAAVGQDYYIGLNDSNIEGTFVWNDGISVGYTNWAASNPTSVGDNVYVSAADGQWRDINGLSLDLTYVMEVTDICSWSEEVNFCCSDAGVEHMVAMRVVDQFGFTNNCMVDVEIQDKVSPTISCPDNVVVSCSDGVDLDNLAVYGEATASDVCGLTLDETVVVNLNQCGVGTITRTFTASDATTSSVCQQVITVENDDLLTDSDVTWPEDLTLDSGCMTQDLDPSALDAPYGYPVVDHTSCDLIGISYTDESYTFDSEGACFKIIRRWSIINWCEIDEPGYEPFEYFQVFKINDLTAPTVTLNTIDATICSYDPDCGGTLVEIIGTATDDCNMDNLTINYEVDIMNDGVIDLAGTTTGAVINLSDIFPIGQHSVVVTFEDMCGNQDGDVAVFEVVSCKTPTAYCINGLSIGLQPMDTDGDGVLDNEMACLFAENVDAGSFHPCGSDVTVAFSTDPDDIKITFDCFSLGDQTVTLYVIDEFGNYDFCTTTVEVQDNNDFELCLDPKDCITFGPDDIEVTGCSTDYDPSVIGGAPTVEDDCICDDYTITFSDTPLGPNADCFAFVRTHVVTFNCGDTPLVCDHRQNVIVRNVTPPTITCPANIIVDMGAMTSACEATVAVPIPTVTGDECSTGIVVTHTTSFGSSGGSNASGVYPVGVSTVTFTVTDACGNSDDCVMTVTVPDDEAPACNVDDITVSVAENGTVTITGDQLDNGSIDNCSGSPVSFTVTPNMFTCADLGDNVVTVTVTDVNGNSSMCNATVTIIDNVGPECNLMNASLTVDAGGTVTVVIDDINDGSNDPCGMITDYSIAPNVFDCTDIGDNTVTVTVTDNNGNTTTCTTTVSISDDVAPVCSVDDITIMASGTSDIIITPMDLNIMSSDACGAVVDAVVNPNAFGCDDIGMNTVTVTVTDNSGNTSTCTATVTVEDTSEPVCNIQDITVSLDENGEVVIDGLDLDNGSSTGCGGDINFTVTPSDFFCNDVGTQVVTVVVSDNNNNSVSCTAEVVIEDSTDPVFVNCPDDVTVDCNFDTSDLSIFGVIDVDDNCAFTVDSTIIVGLNECNVGLITRFYTATDNVGNTATCEQIITVNDGGNSLAIGDIDFPEDITISDCTMTDPEDLASGLPMLNPGVEICGNFGFEFMDLPISTTGEGCLDTIFRQWTVVDSCQFITNGGGVFQSTQMVVVDDMVGPTIIVPNIDTVFVTGPQCEAFLNIIPTTIDCSDVVSGTNNSIVANSNTTLDASGTYGLGTYDITFTATDACGNVGFASMNIVVIGENLPEIECIKIMVEVSPNENVILTPEDFSVQGVGCGDDPVSFFFSPYDAIGDSILYNTQNPFIVATCSFIGDTPIYITAFQSGVYLGACSTVLTTQDIDPTDCIVLETASLVGRIQTEDGQRIEDVKVDIEGDMAGYEMSDVNGDFAFQNLSEGGNYMVEPKKDGDDRNGVSTADIILIQRHLLGMQNLSSPYKHIAADVNKSGSISAADISQIRKLILEHYQEFPENESWRMVESSFNFISGANPLVQNFPEAKEIYDLEATMGAFFTGVKIGDVNNSVVVQSANPSAEYRNAPAYLHISDEVIEIGETQIVLPIIFEEELNGFQLRFDIDNAQVVGVESNLPGFNSSHYAKTSENVVISYNTDMDTHVKDAEIVLTLAVEEPQSLTDVIQLDEEWRNEVYSQGVDFALLGQVIAENAESIVLYQNTPNPWSDVTSITYFSNEEGSGNIKVHDISGRVIYEQNLTHASGVNTISLSREDIGVSGVLYYQISNSVDKAQGKMILID